MLKLILTDLDGTFLNNQGAYNRDYFLKLWPKLKEKQTNDEEGVLQTIELLLSLMEKKEGNTNEN